MRRILHLLLTTLFLALCQGAVAISIGGPLYLLGDAPIADGWNFPGKDAPNKGRAMVTTDDGLTYTAEFTINDGVKYFAVIDEDQDDNGTKTWGDINGSHRYRVSSQGDLTPGGSEAVYSLDATGEPANSLGNGRYKLTVTTGENPTLKVEREEIPPIPPFDDIDFDAITNAYTPKIASNNEWCIFVKTKAKTRLYAWAWDYYDPDHYGGEYYTDGIPWPGQRMSLMGKDGDYYVWKWICPRRDHPITTVMFGNGSTSNSGLTWVNHGMYELPVDASGNPDFANMPQNSGETVSLLSDKPEDPKGSVVYELNIGEFTTEGTFNAARDKLNDLKTLGVNVIWIQPFFELGTSKSPYAVKNFYSVNSAYGTVDDLKTFVSTAQEMGFKVFFDMVADHTAKDADLLTDHPGFYVNPLNTPTDFPDVYLLDLKNNDTQRYLIDVMKYWLEQTDIDGFRCDMVEGDPTTGNLPAPFWSRAISELRNIKPSLIFLAESQLMRDTDKNRMLSNAGFDCDYAWDLQAEWYATKLKDGATQDDVAAFINNMGNSAQYTSISTRMIYTTNHDVSSGRSLNALYGQNADALNVLSFTLPGVPLIYNGLENGYLNTHAMDFTNPATKVDWGTTDPKTYQTIKRLSNLRHDIDALYADASLTVNTVTSAAANARVIAYTRTRNSSKALVVLNLGNEASGDIAITDVTMAEWTKQIDSANPTAEPSSFTFGLTTTINVPAHGYQVYSLDDFLDPEAAGWYVNPQNDLTGLNYKMSQSGNKEYSFTFSSSKFDEMAQNNGTLTFTFSNVYVPENSPKAVKNGDIATAKYEGFDFATNSTALSGTDTDWNTSHKFNLTKIAGVDVYKLSLTEVDGNAPTITLETINEDAVVTEESTFLSCNSDETGLSNKFRRLTTSDDPDGYEYGFLVKAEDFDRLSGYNSNNQLLFKLVPYRDWDGTGIIRRPYDDCNITSQDQDASGYIFRDLKVGEDDYSVYPQAAFTNNPATHFFIIEKSSRYASYDIRLKKDGDNYLVKVVFNKQYNWQGHDPAEAGLAGTPDDVNAGKIIYLYNVDTGHFLWNKGLWGTQAMAPYEEFGLKMRLVNAAGCSKGDIDGTYDNGYYGLFTSATDDENIMTQGSLLGRDEFRDLWERWSQPDSYEGNNKPVDGFYCDRGKGVTSWNILEQSSSYYWRFIPVESGGTAKTYLISVDMYTGNRGTGELKRYYLNVQPTYQGFGRDTYDLVEYDDYRVFYDEGDPSFAGESPDLQKAKEGYYRWQIVTYDDLVNEFYVENEETFSGKEADATFMFTNPDFDRNLSSTIGPASTDNVSWIDENGIRKVEGYMYSNDYYGKDFIAILEGDGTLEQSIEPAAVGIYRVDLNGITANGNEATITVTVEKEGGETYTYPDPALKAKIAQLSADEWNVFRKDGGNVLSMQDLSVKVSETLEDRTQYLTSLYFYVPEEYIGTGSKVTVKIANTQADGNAYGVDLVGGNPNSTGGYTAVDNFRCTYLGADPCVLKHAATTTQNIVDEKRPKVPVYLNRKFTPGGWHAIFLPVDVTVAQLKMAFGNYVRLSVADGLDPTNPYRILFKTVDLSDRNSTAIQAGQYYLVNPENVRTVDKIVERYDETKLRDLDDAEKYISLGYHNMLNVSPGVAPQRSGFKPAAAQFDHNGIRFVGTYVTTTVPGGTSYVFANRQTVNGVESALWHMAEDLPIEAFRFWIQDFNSPANNPGPGDVVDAKYSFYVEETDEELIDDGDGELQSVERVERDSRGASFRRGIYTLSGQRVADGKRLPAGLYIKDGIKIQIK